MKIRKNRRRESIETANLVLACFQPDLFIIDDGGLYLVNRKTYRRRALRQRGDGHWLVSSDRHIYLSGTTTLAVVQLVRWIKNQTRLPMATWDYWAGDMVKLGTPAMVDILRNSDYGDIKKTCCVLCKNPEARIGDWWSLDNVTGPSCYMGRCQLKTG